MSHIHSSHKKKTQRRETHGNSKLEQLKTHGNLGVEEMADSHQNQETTRGDKIDEMASKDGAIREEENKDINLEEKREDAERKLKGKEKVGEIPASRMLEKLGY